MYRRAMLHIERKRVKNWLYSIEVINIERQAKLEVYWKEADVRTKKRTLEAFLVNLLLSILIIRIFRVVYHLLFGMNPKFLIM